MASVSYVIASRPSKIRAESLPTEVLLRGVKRMLEAVRDCPAIRLVSLYHGISVGAPETLSGTAGKVRCIDKKTVMVLRNLRKSTPGESTLVSAKPPQRSALHPFDSIYPFQERFMAPLPTTSPWVRQGEVMRHILALDKCCNCSNESVSVEYTPILPARRSACFPLQVFAAMAGCETWPR